MKVAELRRRWYESEAAHLRMAVLSWLTGRGARPEELGAVNGRVDLRGIPLTASPVTFGDQADPDSAVRWTSLDFSHAQIDGLCLFGASLTDCIFDSARLVDLRLWGATINDCSFRRADTRSHGGLGGGPGLRNVWRRVAFDGANLKESAFVGCVLESCSFSRNGARLVIQDCEVTDCTFHGELNTLIIDGRGHQSPVDPVAFTADFSEATFNDSHIAGYSLRRVRLPSQPDLIVVHSFPAVGRRAIAWLDQNGTTENADIARSILEMWCTGATTESSDLCFDLRGLEPAVAEAVRAALAGADEMTRES